MRLWDRFADRLLAAIDWQGYARTRGAYTCMGVQVDIRPPGGWMCTANPGVMVGRLGGVIPVRWEPWARFVPPGAAPGRDPMT